MEHRTEQPQGLNFDAGDMIAVTKCKEPDLYWSGMLLPKERLSRWWQKILVKDAATYDQGTFPRSLVEIP